MKKLLLCFLVVFAALLAHADVRLPQIFGNNMVLQRNQPIPVWGWAAPGEKVTVQFNKQTKSAKAGKDGKWMVKLNQEAAGGPFQLIVKGKNAITIDSVLVGEVWICSGQSNMEMQVKRSGDLYLKDIHEANYPQIRHFKVEHIISDTLAADITKADWKPANDSNNVADFTSVGYFFAKKLYDELHVPIGLINTSWGGTMVEAWTSREALDKSPDFNGTIKKTFSEAKAAAKEGEFGPNDYPSLLYNGMINPLIPYGIKGAIWYQGETNAPRANQYKKAFPLMITDWRSRWNEGDFPFYFVQLASWKANNGNSEKGSTWAELREAQTSTLSLPNTGMAVTIDIGNTEDIHPVNKKDVGERLAAVALNKLYDKKAEFSGPVFSSINTDGNKVVVSFTHADGLWTKNKYGYLEGFEVAGEDHKFHYAKADIKDGKVVVYSDSVSAPVAVRYAWADDVPEANLFNKDGFPAVPFRSDTWQGITENVKYSVE
jgi:sialate O-acetylesterase